MEYYGVSERKACRVLGQCRVTQRCEPKQIDAEELLRNSVTRLASKYGRPISVNAFLYLPMLSLHVMVTSPLRIFS